VALAASFLLAMTPDASSARQVEPVALPMCKAAGVGAATTDGATQSWRALLDEDGVVAGHRLTVRRGGAETNLRVGRRGFAVPVGDDQTLLGERHNDTTELTMVDTRRACRMWARTLSRPAYPAESQGRDGGIALTLHEPVTRLYEGTVLIDPESGASEAMVDGRCVTSCEPNDGEVLLSAYSPAGAPRPVPAFAAGGWPKDKSLPFAWGKGAVPPDWARTALKSGAADVSRTAAARAPDFAYRSTAGNSVRYTGGFPAYCRYGIACAARSMPSFWAVWLRPHGTDFSWGTLRWCQRPSGGGCFDLRRVMLHELGHVAGLTHPSTTGSPLGANETVMHAITPAKPAAGSTRHAFGRCDVATLQELYDVPSNRTGISTCNDVVTSLRLTPSRSAVRRGKPVRLTAELRVVDRAAYGRLAGNPLNSRAVKLKYRRAGSGAPWIALTMRATNSLGRYELDITPQATWEFRATFPTPPSEGLRYSRSVIRKVKVTK